MSVNLATSSNDRSYRRYRCNRVVGGCGKVGIGPADHVEAWVHRQLVDYLATNPKLPAAIEANDPELERLTEARRTATRDRNAALMLLRDGEIDESEFRVLRTAATNRLTAAQAALDELPVPDREVPDVDAIRHHWDQLPLARKQKAVAHYISAVIVGPPAGNPRDPDERVARRTKIEWRG